MRHVRHWQSGFTWLQVVMVFAVVIAALLGLWQFFPFKPKPTGPTIVRGFIAVAVGGRAVTGAAVLQGEEIHLPSIQVVLREAGTTTDSAPSITDLSGRFTTQVKAPGQYEVCWKGNGFGSGCIGKPFTVSGRFHSLGTVLIPLPREDAVVIYGTVRLADGGTPRAFDALANVNAFALISVLDAKGNPQLEVAVNNHDQYVLTGIKPGQDYLLRIREEKYDRRQGLRVGTGIATQRYDFTMGNSAPRLEPLIARDGTGVRVGTASPGSTVDLSARVSDRDGDPVAFFWRVSAGTLSSATAPNPKWTLPGLTGKHSATLIVYDGRGGYASQSVAVTIDPRGLEFSGRVTGTDAPALANATVDVNGVTATTDANGHFRLFAPDKRRFVMNLRKPGYGFASVIYYDSVIGGTWQLVRASVETVDPTRDIEVTNRRTRGDCPGAPSDRLNWANNAKLVEPHFQDGRGNFVTAPKEIAKLPGLPAREGRKPQRDDCGPGVMVKIPARSLVDANGQAPAGPVTVQLSTVDLQTPNQMPGNYSVLQAGGAIRVMQSYGAGIVELYAGSTKYNLKPGVQATIVIPVDPGQIAAGGPLAPTIPLLHYDETQGVWKPDGTATLATVNGKPAYVAQVSHFTAYNSDLIKQDQSCLAVQNQNMPASYDLEWTIPQTGGAAPVKRQKTVIGGNIEYALLNLPKNTNIVLVPIRTTDPDPNKNQLPMGVFVVNTGAPQNPSWPTVQGGFANEPQGPPYYTTDAGGNPNGACSTKVVLKDLGAQFYPDPAQLLTGAFLHGLQAFAAVNLSDTDPAFPGDANQVLRDAVAAASAVYRKAIDPRGLRTSLVCFKVANGFPLKPSESCPPVAGFTPPAVQPEAKAAYANTVDLGFGREMHCVQNGANAACYVSNYDSLVYTGPGQGGDVSKANKAVDGFNGVIAPDATVAMEFSQLEDFAAPGTPVTTSDLQRVVKFFVFNGAGNPVDSANLDGLGQRPVPQLCMVCHGSAIPNTNGSTTTTLGGVKTPVFRDPAVDAAGSRADVKLNAKFLPFDLTSFSYSTLAGFDRNSQEGAFKTLNEIAKIAPPPDAADPTSSVITALFDTWYPGNITPQKDLVVPLWNTNPQRAAMYTGAIARACRTCHLTNAEPSLRFDRAIASGGATGFDDVLGAVQLRVCKQHVMPHARRTHDLFWTSVNPSQPAQLQVYGDAVKAANPAVGWQTVGGPGVSLDLLCGNEYTQGGGVIVTNTAFSPVKAIFSGACIGCHSDGAASSQAFAFLGLNTDAHAHIVGTNSWELPSMTRITAGNPSGSYLLRKLQNTHTGLGSYQTPGPGVQMPQGGPFLSVQDLNTINGWVTGGAQP
jgi:hypothetical protein